eukprot:SAG31_NODE_22653_length_520_cov_1.897862_1_plen_120_part_00
MAAQEVEGVMVPVEATATAVATTGASVPSSQGPTVPPKAELMALFKATTLRVKEDLKDLQIAEDQKLTAQTADEKELHVFNVEFALETFFCEHAKFSRPFLKPDTALLLAPECSLAPHT